MARVRINRVQVRVTGVEAGLKIVRQVMYEVSFSANLILLRGDYSSGRLAASIESDGPHVIGTRVTGSVGSHLPYAASVHDGAKVHWIFPKSSRAVRFGSHRRPQLKFYWRKAGRVVYLPHIPGSRSRIGRSHPGQPGKKFLTDPLREAARRHGMRVIIYDV
jgi:hypothetical protein